MTAKDLLSARLTAENPKLIKKIEFRGLKKLFRNKSLELLLRHPTHGCAAVYTIPIHYGRDYFDFLEDKHTWTNLRLLSVHDYLQCEAVLQVVPGVDFTRCMNY